MAEVKREAEAEVTEEKGIAGERDKGVRRWDARWKGTYEMRVSELAGSR